MKDRVLVSGSSGFIGHHLVRFLKDKGYWVRGVDIVKPEYSTSEADEFIIADLTKPEEANRATLGIDKLYQLAAVNGSIEMTTTDKADLVTTNALINLNLAKSCIENRFKRVFFSSSACVYPIHYQSTDEVHPLKEEDSYPADPDSEYGWEKLFSERLWRSYEEDYGLEVRIGRYFNVYGHETHLDTTRSKAPMALTRKVLEAGDGGDVYIWGDGNQKRSFVYIDDCVRATYMMMESDIHEPVNIGTEDLVKINELVDIIADIEGVKVNKIHQMDKVQGVRTRHADFSRAYKELKWEKKTSMKEGMTVINKFAHKELKI